MPYNKYHIIIYSWSSWHSSSISFCPAYSIIQAPLTPCVYRINVPDGCRSWEVRRDPSVVATLDPSRSTWEKTMVQEFRSRFSNIMKSWFMIPKYETYHDRPVLDAIGWVGFGFGKSRVCQVRAFHYSTHEHEHCHIWPSKIDCHGRLYVTRSVGLWVSKLKIH